MLSGPVFNTESPGFPLSERDLAAVLSLRRLLVLPSAADRETLASYAHGYVRAYVMTRLRRKRFGFDEGFGDVATWIADREIGRLLEQAEVAGGTCLPRLRKALAGRLRRAGAEAPLSVSGGEPVLEDIDDVLLLQSLRAILRGLADQGTIRAWKESHPQRARELRCVKRAVAASRGIGIERDLWGQILVSDRSDRRHPPMNRETLLTELHPVPWTTRKLVARLRAVLKPGPDHGGYCHLMDLLVVWERLLNEEFRRGLGSPDATTEVPLVMGLPAADVVKDLRRRVEHAARGLLRADRSKGRFDGDPDRPDCRLTRAYLAIATEMVLRRYRIDDPAWTHVSQRELIEVAIPDARDAGTARVHRGRIDYLVRRLGRASSLR